MRIRLTKLTLFLVALGLGVSPLTKAATDAESKYFHETLAPLAYEPTKAVSLDILKRFPPTEYQYVTLGRSPTAVQAMLEILAPESVTRLPVSGLTTFVKTGAPADLEKALVTHFQNYLPSKEKLQQKKLLYIDYSISGTSLDKGIDLGRKALPNAVHEGYLLGVPRAVPAFKNIVHLNESLENSQLNSLYAQEVFDKWAAYEATPVDRLRNLGFKPKLNPDFDILKTEFRHRFNSDPDFKSSVAKTSCAMSYSILSR